MSGPAPRPSEPWPPHLIQVPSQAGRRGGRTHNLANARHTHATTRPRIFRRNTRTSSIAGTHRDWQVGRGRTGWAAGVAVWVARAGPGGRTLRQAG